MVWPTWKKTLKIKYVDSDMYPCSKSMEWWTSSTFIILCTSSLIVQLSGETGLSWHLVVTVYIWHNLVFQSSLTLWQKTTQTTWTLTYLHWPQDTALWHSSVFGMVFFWVWMPECYITSNINIIEYRYMESIILWDKMLNLNQITTTFALPLQFYSPRIAQSFLLSLNIFLLWNIYRFL